MMTGSNGKIASVIFDLGGVLIEQPIPAMMNYCAERLTVSPQDLLRAHERHAPDFQRGRIDEAVYWERVCGEMGVPCRSDGFLWGSAFRFAYSEYSDIFLLADLLHRKNYRIGLLSDTEVPSMNFFLSRGYGQFDFLVFSCREGFIKPDRRIFELALARSGVAAERTVFIDDRPANVEGAKKAGIRTVLFRDPGQVKNELAAMGVQIGGD